ncbi:hypothetical protein TcCL_ESM05091 [Trypanosoma cruzi]|nr:hypothetical protein TcCL_ESM05091 [Trypanosoma cruzi]
MCGFKQHQYSGGSTKYAMVPFAGDVARFTVNFLKFLFLLSTCLLVKSPRYASLCGSPWLIIGRFEGPSFTCYEWAWFKDWPRTLGFLVATTMWAKGLFCLLFQYTPISPFSVLEYMLVARVRCEKCVVSSSISTAVAPLNTLWCHSLAMWRDLLLMRVLTKTSFLCCLP